MDNKKELFFTALERAVELTKKGYELTDGDKESWWLDFLAYGTSDSNPYSGVGFDYDGHHWGMCARDGGVEILIDSVIKSKVFYE